MSRILQSNALKKNKAIAEYHLKNGEYTPTLEKVLAALLEITESEFGFIGEVRHDVSNDPYLVTHALTNIAWNPEVQKIYDQRPMIFRNLDTLFGECLKTANPVLTNNVSKHPASRGVPPGHPILKRFLGIPLKWSSKHVGMVGLANRPRNYYEHHIDALAPLLSLGASIVFQFSQDRKINQLKNQLLSIRQNSPLLNFETARIGNDLFGKFIEVNESLQEVLKYDSLQILYHKADGFFSPASLELINETIDRLTKFSVNDTNQTVTDENSNHYRIRVELIDRYQQTIPIELNLSLAINIDNMVSGLVCSGTLIGIEEASILDANSQSIDNWPALLNRANLGVVALDTEGKLIDWNHTMEILTGFSKDNVLCKKYDAFVIQQEDSSCTRKIEALISGKSPRITFETSFRTRAGQLKMLLNAVPIKDNNLQIKGVLCLGQDITQINENAQTALQAQKMEAIGLMAGGLAHDLNNILAIIKGNLELIYSETLHNSELAAMVTDALSSAMDGYDITRRLTAFSRAQPMQIRDVPVNSLITGFLKILSRGLKKNIRLEFNDQAHDAVIRIDPNQFETALLNLVLNSRDAIGEKESGRIIIKCTRMVNNSNPDDHTYYLKSGDYLVLTVSDNGCGMKPSTRVQALNPYFTTKPIGLGTGFGLTMVDRFTRDNGGGISIKSTYGMGTSVIIYLPLSPLSSKSAVNEVLDDEDSSYMPKSNQIRTKVLVVDDNEKLLRVLVKSLQDWGFEVTAAENADAALRILSSSTDVEILLSDIVMHGSLSGRDLVKEVTTRFPHISSILMTGYEAKNSKDINLTIPVLYKPFSRTQFFEVLKEFGKNKYYGHKNLSK